MKEQNFKIPFESIREAFYVYCDMIERHGKGIKGTPITYSGAYPFTFRQLIRV
jgi:hypothetical protein